MDDDGPERWGDHRLAVVAEAGGHWAGEAVHPERIEEHVQLVPSTVVRDKGVDECAAALGVFCWRLGDAAVDDDGFGRFPFTSDPTALLCVAEIRRGALDVDDGVELRLVYTE